MNNPPPSHTQVLSFLQANLSSKNSYQMSSSKVHKPNKWEAMGHTGQQHNRNNILPKKVAEGEL
jgi:hypothetical protein